MPQKTLRTCAVIGVFFVGPNSGQSAEVPAKLQAVIAKTQSFGLGCYPISFWNYTNLAKHGQYMDEAEVAEWADAGFTVPQSPDPDLALIVRPWNNLPPPIRQAILAMVRTIDDTK